MSLLDLLRQLHGPKVPPDRAERDESGEAIEIAARMVGVGHQPRAYALDQDHPRLELRQCISKIAGGRRCPNYSTHDRCARHRRRNDRSSNHEGG